MKKIIISTQEDLTQSIGFQKNIILFENYTFIFIPPFMDIDYDAMRKVDLNKDIKKMMRKLDPRRLTDETIEAAMNKEINAAGALKYMIDDIMLGGDESLFDVLVMVVKDDKVWFPLLFYRGASGIQMQGWDVEDSSFIDNYIENKNSIRFINIHNLNIPERRELYESLLLCLERAPKADFDCLLEEDLGTFQIGLKAGEPFREIEENLDDEDYFWEDYKDLGNKISEIKLSDKDIKRIDRRLERHKIDDDSFRELVIQRKKRIYFYWEILRLIPKFCVYLNGFS